MARLVIETATAACSVALIEEGDLIAQGHDVVGRGHAERLLPMIAALPGGGRAKAILVDCGPGSFTGVRVGIAAARALGLGWGVPVAGFSSLALIAVAAFAADPTLDRLTVAIPGGHGEYFVQSFSARPFAARSDLASLPPADAARVAGTDPVAGPGAEAIVAMRGSGSALPGFPAARDAVLLDHAFAALPASPIYGRAPDAKPAAA
ncbi:tRNA (adenosine(37)-N6)-threonylcarbamoyltransferase complex dimerization subunit type 1 TsaB [Sphingomonas sp. 1P06PA]|uniref:tRNA (adenosine(37)-N6)-threonylcarbamoyltransferase complex dimerization subunit type 1 TsaB n=1 Tax=Sphingomonas sp. 1P06PA TaxID=554121 RepID=UPI0039A41300